MKNVVFVASSSGWVAHGRPRVSEEQAAGVARSLAKRLGWATAVGPVGGPESPCPAAALAPALAGLSPVWKDPGLAVAWAASGRGGPRRATAPVAAPAVPRVVRLFGPDGLPLAV